jgi:hypothetical protein
MTRKYHGSKRGKGGFDEMKDVLSQRKNAGKTGNP